MMGSRVIPWSVCVMNEWREGCWPHSEAAFHNVKGRVWWPCRRHRNLCPRNKAERVQGKAAPNLSHSNLIFLPQLPIWPFYERLKLVYGDKAFYAAMHLRRRWWCKRFGWKEQSMRSWPLRGKNRVILSVAVNTWGEAVDAETQHGSFSGFLPWAGPFAYKCISQECYTGYQIDQEYWIPQKEEKQAFLHSHILKDCKEWRENAMSCI